MIRKLKIQIAVILLFSGLVFYAHSQETVHFGLNTTARNFSEEIKYALELGVGVVRLPLGWEMVQPRAEEFDWDITDRIVELAEVNQVEVLFIVRSISLWGTKELPQVREGMGYHSATMPVDLKQWERFVQALAARYQGRGVHYEIENEVSAPAFWQGTMEEYCELLKASYTAIKWADPQAIVLVAAMPCGISRNFTGPEDEVFRKYHDDWLQAILFTKAFDVVSVHNYYFPSKIKANGFTFRSYLEHVHDLMKQAGVGDRPIWVTETGFISEPANASDRLDQGSLEQQANWLAEAYEQAFDFGVERVFWLLLRDRDEKYFSSTGLEDMQGKPRPAWDRLQQITKVKE